MKFTTRLQLSAMMFLEFFIWGAWFVTLGTFLINNLHANGAETGAVFSTQSWGAIIAPFIIGLIADRFFNAEKILGILHIAGAILLYQVYSIGAVTNVYPPVVFYYLLIYMILFMPTLALVNSISFNQMTNTEKQFPPVRVWGTIGWIVAGLAISFFVWDSEANIAVGLLKNTFLMASVASLALGIFSFTLPKTRPKIAKGAKVKVSEILGLDALKLLKDKNYLIFFIASILIDIPLAFYYQYANPFLIDKGMANATAKMSLGQFFEIFFLLLLPFFFKKFGFKKTIMAGMLAWAVRYALFAYGNAGDLTFMLIIGIILHGICYDFFMVSGQIYTDAKAGTKFKSAAQGLITLATYGIGMLIGFWIAGLIKDAYTTTTIVDNVSKAVSNWKMIWIIPSIIALVVFLLFAIFFNDKNEKPVEQTVNI
ncbi:MAG TPA: MFS transporter [Hanamia sp.]|jgi:nucleoside transporter|nr:MFS transporter [Hanamia sp.]